MQMNILDKLNVFKRLRVLESLFNKLQHYIGDMEEEANDRFNLVDARVTLLEEEPWRDELQALRDELIKASNKIYILEHTKENRKLTKTAHDLTLRGDLDGKNIGAVD